MQGWKYIIVMHASMWAGALKSQPEYKTLSSPVLKFTI